MGLRTRLKEPPPVWTMFLGNTYSYGHTNGMHRNRMYGTGDHLKVRSSHTATLDMPGRAGFGCSKGQCIPCHPPWKGTFFIDKQTQIKTSSQVKTGVLLQYQVLHIGSFLAQEHILVTSLPIQSAFTFSCFISLHSIGRKGLNRDLV